MYSRLESKLIHQARMLAPYSDGVHKHVSFLVHRNRIVSIGINNYKHVHPKGLKYGYISTHSELAAIVHFPKQYDIKRCRMYNVRIRKSGDIGLSAPCCKCAHLIAVFNIRDTFYTGDDGLFHEWNP